MNKLLPLFSAVIILVIAQEASAKIGSRHLEEELKHTNVCLPLSHTETSSTTDEQGVGGDVFEISIDGVSTPASTALSTTNPSSIQWPAKLDVKLLDAHPTAALSCSAVILKGEDQFGRTVMEAIGPITTTAKRTRHVYSKLGSVSAVGCEAGGTGDLLYIQTSKVLGLTRRIKTHHDVESACIEDASDSGKVKCANSNNGTDDDLESAVSELDHTIDVGASIFAGTTTTAAANGDEVCFRLRSAD